MTDTQRGSRPEGSADEAPAIQNLCAFARLYGYVRYFHPSDAASMVDWERFAIYGARQMQQAETPSDLQQALARLFGSLAPTMQLYATGEEPPAPDPMLTPRDTAGLKLVAWQHRGVGMGNPGPYRSVRLNRAAPAHSEGPGFGSIGQSVDAAPYQGKQVRLRAAVRAEVEGREGQAQLWLRVDRPEKQRGFFSNMGDRPVRDSVWKTYEITGAVADDATRIVLGGFLAGDGKAWFDDFQLSVRENAQEDWTSVPLQNAAFQQEGNEESLPGWGFGAPGYRASTTTENAYEGARALRVETPPSATAGMAQPLFAARPRAGEVVNKPLGRGLSVQLPLALYSKGGQTLRPEDAPSPGRLHAELEGIELSALTAKDAALRYRDVVIAWNVFQHFYPYFDVVDTDWNAVLAHTLRRAAADETSKDFLRTLRRMTAQLDDGHASVGHPLMQKNAGLPLRTDMVEGKVVVTVVADSSADVCVRRGDVVTAIGGTPIQEVLQASKQYLSGSPQWKTQQALGRLERGERGTSVLLTLRRGTGRVTCRVTRTASRPPPPERLAPIEEIKDGIYYVDLSAAEMSAIAEQAQTLAEAEGVIFDLRGYPNGNHAVLQYLATDTLRSARWQVPQQIYPDQERRVGYDTSGRWALPPKEPHFTGTAIFLTGPGAISYAESVMGIVEHYELGEIVGQPTAGANGNVNPFALPGGYRVRFTGMRVVKHDGSQHHLVGIQPTVPAERTIEGVRAGHDEYIAKALELIRAKDPVGGEK